MIAYVHGEIVEIGETKVIVDVHGIGYQIFITGRDAQALPPIGKKVKLHTYFSVKEDSLQLFGFLSKDDMEIFKLLLNVNGVGPKAALGLLSSMPADDLRFAILAADAKSISKAPGIGNKTAQKVILELKDKLNLEDALEKRQENQGASPACTAMNDAKSEAVQALTALGYSNGDALKAVQKAEVTEDMSTEDVLRAALKHLSFL